VYLVGGGPGDPGLITVKGLRCLQQADVVVYDRLIDPSLIQAAPASSEHVFVGKERGRHALSQEEINRLLVERAIDGKTVVRLKGGDPFLFGRGGEEALVLASYGIAFEVVPGVTSAFAAAAYAGIPVTHRGEASLVTVVNGSDDPAKNRSPIHWNILARAGGTLVIMMGWASMESIVHRLRQEGLAASTPMALVQWGTWNKQLTVVGDLDNILARALSAGLESPVIAVIGSVVGLREQLRWFDRRTLFGKRVLVTRSRTQASRLVALLKELGAQPVVVSSIEIVPLEDYTVLDAMLSRLTDYDWVFFTSVNTVEVVFSRLTKQNLDVRAFGNVRVGAIGPATAEALAGKGIRADFIPSRAVSEVALGELANFNWVGVSVLMPGADIGRDVLPLGLSRLGATVERVTAYRTVEPSGISKYVRDELEQGVDVVIFTSSSTVRNLLSMLDDNVAFLKSSLIAAIGPVTADTAEKLGLQVDLVPDEHTVDGLVSALVDYFNGKETSIHG
jgi:uroporphyrinogen III methyltransferase/synthase